MPNQCWCQNELIAKNFGRINVLLCSEKNNGTGYHQITIYFPADLVKSLQTDLESAYEYLLPLLGFKRGLSPLTLQHFSIRSLILSCTVPCLENGCGGLKFLCEDERNLIWIGECGHYNSVSR